MVPQLDYASSIWYGSHIELAYASCGRTRLMKVISFIINLQLQKLRHRRSSLRFVVHTTMDVVGPCQFASNSKLKVWVILDTLQCGAHAVGSLLSDGSLLAVTPRCCMGTTWTFPMWSWLSSFTKSDTYLDGGVCRDVV